MGPVALGVKHPGIKPLNLPWDCWRISKMKSFFGRKNTKCSTSPIELTGSNHVNVSGPKNLRSANMKVHTHFANKNYFGFPQKKAPETLPKSEWQVSKNQPKHRVFSFFFSVSKNFPKWKSNKENPPSGKHRGLG